MISDSLFERFYPDDARNGTIAFYNWVREYIGPQIVMLNLGAGRNTGQPIRTFKGEVKRVVGADIDPIVAFNDELDEARIIKGGALPFADSTFDVALSDFVLEHVREPGQFLAEVHRVLKPEGSFFFRTPNRHHYVAIVARLTPHWFHERVANPARGLANDAPDPHVTYYRLNTRATIAAHAGRSGFRQSELRMWEAHPSYLVFNSAAFVIGVAYERLVNRFETLAPIRANIFGRLVK